MTITIWQQWMRLLDWTNTSIINIYLKSQGPFLYIYLYFKTLIAFPNVQTEENKHLSLMYTNALNNTPS